MTGFKELNLSGAALHRLETLGFKQPTPIQQEAIPALIEGRNVVGQAQTGSGKTLAFSLPILEKVTSSLKTTQALILAPTRELVTQITQVLLEIHPAEKSSLEKNKLKIVPIYGGASKENQRHSMKHGAQVIVATPGRLLDFLREGAIRLDAVKIVILDEADRMLEMGFIEDVKLILSRMPKQVQKGLFSATIPPAVHEIIQTYLTNPHHIRLGNHHADKPKIKQMCYGVEPQEKLNTLLRIMDIKNGSILIFCRTRGGADKLTRKLLQSGHPVGTIHGGKSQAQRDSVMRGFRKGHPSVLVATDLASRGLDIHGVSQVVNYDIPVEPGDYLHRIGRTGRAGREGTAMMLVTPLDTEGLTKIERLLGKPLQFADEAPRPRHARTLPQTLPQNSFRRPGSNHRSNHRRRNP